MAGNFLYLGAATAATTSKFYPEYDPTVGSTAYTWGSTAYSPYGTVDSLTLGTAASSAATDAYAGFGILVTSGSGVGQMRRIRNSTTAGQAVVTVRAWNVPKPDSGSTFVVGVMQDGRDGFVVKAEHGGTAGTGTFRAAFWTGEDAPKLVFSTPWSALGIGSAAAATGAGMISTTAAIHGETRVIDYLNPMYRISKVFVEASPTADVQLFGAAVFTSGRRENR